MSIATYGDLKTAVANWLNRSDLTARIPEFVSLCEDRLFLGSEEPPYQSDPLRIRAMETSADIGLTGGTQTAALPSGYIEMKRLYLSDTPSSELRVASPEYIHTKYALTDSSRPQYYATEADNLIFGPVPDSGYTAKALYYARFAALSSDSDTNWLLSNARGAYLWGTLVEAYTFARNADMAQVAYAKFCGVVNAVKKSNDRDRFSGGQWVTRPEMYTP